MDDDEERSCSICYNMFNLKERSPKLLECLHRICLLCCCELIKGERKECHICRHPICVEDANNLADDKFVKSMLLFSCSIPGEEKCTYCDDGEIAEGKCLTCGFFLCEECVKAHKRFKRNKEHNVVNLGNYSPQTQIIENTATHCKLHEDLQYEYFCVRPCNKSLCKTCVFDHSDHKTRELNELYKETNEVLNDRKEELLSWKNQKSELLSSLTEAESSCKDCDHRIKHELDLIKNDCVNTLTEFFDDLATGLQSEWYKTYEEIEAAKQFIEVLHVQISQACKVLSKAQVLSKPGFLESLPSITTWIEHLSVKVCEYKSPIIDKEHSKKLVFGLIFESVALKRYPSLRHFLSEASFETDEKIVWDCLKEFKPNEQERTEKKSLHAAEGNYFDIRCSDSTAVAQNRKHDFLGQKDDRINCLVLRYGDSDFPRYKYHSTLLQECLKRYEEGADTSMYVLLKTNIQVLAIGEVPNNFTDSLCKKKRTSEDKMNLTLEEILHYHKKSPDAIIYICFSQEIFKDLFEGLRKVSPDENRLILIDENSTCAKAIPSVTQENAESGEERFDVQCSLSSIRSCVTSLLEDSLLKQIEQVDRETRLETKQDTTDSLSHLRMELQAISKRIRRCSLYRSMTEEATPNISPKVEDFIKKNKEHILSYGVQNGQCRIVVRDNHIKEITKQFESLPEQETKTKVNIMPQSHVEFQAFTKHIKQGDELYNENYRLGTLGGFAKLHESSTRDVSEICITCSHFCPKSCVAFIKEKGGRLTEFGKCLITDEIADTDELLDVSLIKIDKSKLSDCLKLFKNRLDIPCNAIVYKPSGDNFELESEPVHKIGASTGKTDGYICGWEEIKTPEMADYKNAILVKFHPGMKFAEEGDSGSIVFRHSDDADQETIEIIAVVCGEESSPKPDEQTALTEHEKWAVYRQDSNVEKRTFIVCSNFSKFVSYLKSTGRDIQFYAVDDETEEGS